MVIGRDSSCQALDVPQTNLKDTDEFKREMEVTTEETVVSETCLQDRTASRHTTRILRTQKHPVAAPSYQKHNSIQLSAGVSNKPQVCAGLRDVSDNRDHWNTKHEQRIDSAIDMLLEIKNLTAV